MSRVYGVWLTPAGQQNPMPEYWEGVAVHVLDALAQARNAVGNNRVWRCKVAVVAEDPSGPQTASPARGDATSISSTGES